MSNISGERFFYRRRLIFTAVCFIVSGVPLILVYLYLNFHYNFDTSFKDSEKICRVVKNYSYGGKVEKSATVPFSFADALQDSFPDIVQSRVRLAKTLQPVISVETDKAIFNETEWFFVDSVFPDFFNLKILSGNENALNDSNSCVLSVSASMKFFPGENPVGRKIKVFNNREFVVAGVIEDAPVNSHLHFSVLTSLTILKFFVPGAESDKVWSSCYTYIKLKKNEDFELLNKKLPEFKNKYYEYPRCERISLHLQHLTDIHLGSQNNNEFETAPGKRGLIAVEIFGFLLAVILLINFCMLNASEFELQTGNLTIERLYGLPSLSFFMRRFFRSAILISICIFSAFVIAELILPFFKFSYFFTAAESDLLKPDIWLKLIILILFISLVSTVLPIIKLKRQVFNNISGGRDFYYKKRRAYNSVFISVQFLIVSLLIIISLSSIRQLIFFYSAELGFNRDNIIYVPVSNISQYENYSLFMSMINQSSYIDDASYISDILGKTCNSSDVIPIGFPIKDTVMMPEMEAESNFVNIFDLELIAGRDFDPITDNYTERKIIINESAAKMLGCKQAEQAIGKVFSGLRGDETIIGVLKDFHISSLHDSIKPLSVHMLNNLSGNKNYIVIKYNSLNRNRAFDYIRKAWYTCMEKMPFDYLIFDSELRKQYINELINSVILTILSLFALFISLWGFAELSKIAVEIYAREIRIRISLGAGFVNILALFYGKYLISSLVSGFAIIPAGFLFTEYLYKDFSYTADISVWSFAIVIPVFATLSFAITAERINTIFLSPTSIFSQKN